MSRVKANELERAGAAFKRLGAFLVENASDIARRANTDADDGVRGVSYDRSRSAPGHSDPVAARVGRECWDPVHHVEDRFVSLLRTMMIEAGTVERSARAFLAITPKQANALLKGGDLDEETVQSICANPACKRDVAGTPNDRLRSGRCEPCWKFRQRKGEERPRELCYPDLEAEAV